MALRHSRHPMAPSWRWLLLVAFALLLILLTARAAAAENLGPGGSRVIVGDEVMGSYRLLVTSAPSPATTGTVTFVVRITDAQTGVAVRDAQVEIELSKGGQVIRQAATHQNAGNAIDYVAHIQIADEGSWAGIIRVNAPAGNLMREFTQQVTAPRTVTTVILVGIPFAAILVVFAALWLARSRSRDEAASPASVAQAERK